jgi:hypothetical protein
LTKVKPSFCAAALFRTASSLSETSDASHAAYFF